MIADVAKFARLVALRRSRLPEEIQIEVTNRCNLDCRMCPRERWGISLADMPWERYVAILDRLPPALSVLTLTGWGEPLVHPRFADFLREARRRFPRARVRFTTNGLLLDARRRREVLRSGVSQVTLSVDLDGEGTGEGHPPDRSATDRFAALAQERDRPVELLLQAVIVSPDAARLAWLVRYAAEQGLQGLNLARLQPLGTEGERFSRPSFEEERAVLAVAYRLGRAHGVRILSAIDHTPAMRLAGRFDARCLRTDNYAYIDLDGNVTPCCTLRHLAMGNLLATPLASIWEGERWRAFFAERCDGCDALRHRPLPEGKSGIQNPESETASEVP